jgi:hypothetical protein
MFAFPVSILLRNPLSPAFTVFSCSASYSKALLTFNPCPVNCCPSCHLSCLSPPSILSKELYPNTQCNIQSQLSFSSFCEPIIISLTVLAEHPVHRCSPFILSWVSSPSYPVLSLRTYFLYFVMVAMTSHNSYCHCHLLQQKEVPSVHLQQSFWLSCRLSCAFLMSWMSCLCLNHQSCPALSVFTYFPVFPILPLCLTE